MIPTETISADDVASDAPALPLAGRALAGLVAAGVALGVAELVAGLFRGTASPVVSVGEWVIDHVPSFVKTFAIRTFGANDKQALIIGTLVLLAVIACFVGVLAFRNVRSGVIGVAAFGVIGGAAAVTRPGAMLTSLLPSLVGAGAGVVAIIVLVGAASPPVADPGAEMDFVANGGLDRRRFFFRAAALGAIAAGSAGLGQVLRKRFDVSAARAGVSLPAAASPAAALPSGVDLAVPGLTPFVTPSADFYRVDTALTVPQIDPETWALEVGGMVDNSLELSYTDLLDRPLVERDITLVCVSNEVGGQYAGHAKWLGVPLADVLREAGVQPGANQLVSRSSDGWTAGTPVEAVMDGRDALIVVGMNGEPLPIERGFPVRLVIPGLYGYVSATKWLTGLELTTFASYDAYWKQRGWAAQAPIKTFSRIDTPRGLSTVSAGRIPIAGMAWAIHRGITKVEVMIDDGPWQEARLGDAPTGDTWRQWLLEWDATPGSHTITCRATDGTGTLQTDQRAEPIPDGASGWHQVVVLVS